MDLSISEKRKAKKTKWIRALQAAYLYGAIDQVDDKTIANKDKAIGSTFPSLKLK